MTWRIVAFAVIAVFPFSLSGTIVGFRDYHGKRATCVYSGVVSLARPWGVRTTYARVFVGTVKSATMVGDFEKRVELVPDETFVGDASEVTAITNQACLDAEIQAGQRWLVYLFRNPRNNELVLGYEGRSKPIEQAQKDIAILRHLSRMTDSGIIIGRVGRAGHFVEAKRVSDGKQFSAVSDANGNYELDLPSGEEYFLTANTKKGLWAPETEVLVFKQDCTQLDFWLQTDGRIAGTIETADGKAASYVQVAIVPLSPVGASFTVTTDGQGHFEVGGRLPGQYLVGVGILAPVDSAEWKSRVYYPGLSTREQAHTIELGKGEWRTDVSFMLPPSLTSP